MDPLALAAVLVAALGHATWNALVKGGTDPLKNSVGLSACWSLLGLPLLLVVPAPGARAVPLLCATVVVHVAYFALLTRAYRVADFSVVYPIARGLPPVLVLAASVALGEDRVSRGALAGVCLVSLGIASLSRGLSAVHRAGAWLAVATALLIAVYTLIDGIGARTATSPASFIVWLVAVQGTVFSVGAVLLHGTRILPRGRDEVVRASFVGVVSGGSYFVVLWAMTRAPIAIVSALRETGVLFGAVIGVFMLREPFGARRLLSAGLITAGIVVIQLAG